MFRLYRFASIVIPRLPYGLVMMLSRVIAFAAWLLARKARKQATINMKHVPGPHLEPTRAGRKKLRRIVRKMFQYSARNYLETLYLPHLKPEEIMKRIRYTEGLEHLDEALAQGKGVIVLSAHFGPFEYVGQWFAVKALPITIPVERLKDERMLELMLKLRRGQGLHLVPLGGSAPLRSMIQALRGNQIVLFTVDRAIEGESVEKPFFGVPARFPFGPLSLALRTGAALVWGFAWYMPDSRMTGQLVPVSLALSEDERKDPDKLMQKVIEALEQTITMHPEQWVMFSPIWTEN